MSNQTVPTSIEIRSLKTIEELEKVQELDKLVWGMKESVPTHQTLTAVKNGGMVIGAYIEDELIGFQYSFAGFNGKETYLCSHMLGIHPDFRHLGIGEKLKHAQREEAEKLGYKQITWTYDPLESVNAYLNIGKLGAVVSTYIPDAYGEMSDPLNQGLASDRFLAEWWIADSEQNYELDMKRNEEFFSQKNVVIDWTMNEKGLPVPKEINLTLDNLTTPLFVPIPDQFQQMKKGDQQLAIEWRMKTREAFMYYFSKGWMATAFLKDKEKTNGVHFYVLTKEGEENGN